MPYIKPVSFVAILGIVLVVLSLQHGGLGTEQASAAGGGPELALTITQGGTCDGADCYAGTGSTFKLSVVLDHAPASGYVMVQSFIDFGVFDPTASEDGAGPNTCSDGIDNVDLDGRDRFDDDCVTVELTYIPAPGAADEIVWPDVHAGVALRADLDYGFVYHGGTTGIMPPLPASYYEGTLFTLELSCPAAATDVPISILPYDDPIAFTSGAFLVAGDAFTRITPKVDSITLHCIAPQAHPGDTDGDGCSDANESGTDPTLGGGRDWFNPWDFYDVAGAGGVPVPDGVIDLANDYMGVAAHYSPSGGPPYDVHYDRGQSSGHSWKDTAGPDGVIDLANDILGVISQINHTCG